MTNRTQRGTRLALVALAVWPMAATGVVCLHWVVLSILHPPDDDVLLSSLYILSISVYLLLSAVFVYLHYFILMLFAGLPVLLLAAKLGVRSAPVAAVIGALVTATAGLAYFNALLAGSIIDFPSFLASQMISGATAGVGVWVACRQHLTPRPAPPS